ncbi:MAG: diguanylate cyclase [Candidatus Firestonebacteria bacterium]
MKNNLICTITIFLVIFSCQSIFAESSIQAVASPSSVIAGEEAKITVYTLDKKGVTTRGIKVNLSVIMGGGKITPTEDISDTSGSIKAILKTGPIPGINEVKIESPGLPTIYVNVEGKPSPPTEFSIKLEPDKIYIGQSATLLIEVKNGQGNPAKSAQVKFTPGDLITINPSSIKTDDSGKVKVTVLAGKQIGTTKIDVQVENLESKSVDFEILVPTAKNILTSATPDTIYIRSKSTIKAKMIDTIGSPMPDIKIDFVIESGDASLNITQGVTDSKGEITAILTSGSTAETVVVKVIAKDFTPVEVKIIVNASTLPPAHLSAVFAYQNIATNDDVTLTATVTDKEGRLITGATVYFEVTRGGGRLLSKSSVAEAGKVSTILTTGEKAGKNTVKVSCGNLKPIEVSVMTEGQIQYVREKADTPSKLYGYAYPNNSVVNLPSKIYALITDDNYLPVPKSKVNFKIIKGEGTLSKADILTDENGEAFVYLTSQRRGEVEIKITASLISLSRGVVVSYDYPIWYLIIFITLIFVFLFGLYILRKNKIKSKNLSPLTNLPSDIYLKYKVNNFIKNKKRFSAIFIDIDDFKHYNLSYGFEKGDTVIKSFAKMLSENASSSDILVHLGGDDFVIITNPKKVESLTKKILHQFEEKIKTFYSEQDKNKGFTTVKNEDGALFNYPLITISLGILNSEKFTLTNYNEFLDIAGKLMKSAKSKEGNACSDTLDDDSERDSKEYRIGWWTIGALLLSLIFSPKVFSAIDQSKNLSGWTEPQIVGAGEKVKITAHLSDAKDRPVNNAYVLFTIEEGDGSLSNGFCVTKQDGNCSVEFITGIKRGVNIVKLSCGKAVPYKLKITGRINSLEVLTYFVVVVFAGFSILLLIRILNMKFLLKGIDKDVGSKTRPSGERMIKSLISSGTEFSAIFIEYRKFSEFSREHGFEQGEKAIRTLAEQIKSAIKEYGNKWDAVFYYGEDRFMVISRGKAESMAKNLIEEMEIHIPILCEDKNTNYYLLHLSLGIVLCQIGKIKNLGEIMQKGGKLINEVKSKPGSDYLIN